MIWRRGLITLAILLAWEALARTHLLSPLIFGSPALIVQAAITNGAAFLAAAEVTFTEMLIAIAISWVGGITLGLLIGARLRPALVISPMLSGIIALPLVVLYPAMVAWFGIGPLSKIIFGTITGLVPIMLATIQSMQSIDPSYVIMARAGGATSTQIVTQVTLRLAFPGILSGLRIGTSLAIVGVIQSEMLAATDGLGYLISYYRSLFGVGQVYLGIALVLFAAGLANFLMNRVAHHFDHWRTR